MQTEASNQVHLRTATPEDAPFLRAVYASTREEELAQVPWTTEQKQAFTDGQFASQDAHYRAHYPTAEFFIIEKAGTPIGRLYVDRWSREVRIMDISLLPPSRGTGVGTRLLQELQEEARSEGKALSIH